MAKDKLDDFNGLSICPNCGCIDQKGIYRCLGCGTFHSGAHLVEREAPPIAQPVEVAVVEPSAYSLGPKGEIVDEKFEQSENVREWSGGSTDFSMGDDDSEVSSMKSNDEDLPESEEL
tara:strand:- start:17 stop:370 length:354 start_codon:yes stop_codon:yes gene_type:complete